MVFSQFNFLRLFFENESKKKLLKNIIHTYIRYMFVSNHLVKFNILFYKFKIKLKIIII